SEHWRRQGSSSDTGRLHVVGRLRALQGFEPAFDRTSEQQLEQPFIRVGSKAHEPVFAAVDTLDLELLPRLDTVPLPDLGGQDDLVAGSDSHAGGTQPEENNFKGVHGDNDATPKTRIVKPANPYSYQVGSGGLTGIWAEQNTRESLFAALKRNETFGTSGVRLRPRFFGGWNFAPDLIENTDWLKAAYRDGVPMGGNLSTAPAGKAPTFVVAAMKDPDGANLDRIQVIKGWIQGGETFDKIYDVALSDGRTVDPATGKAPPVGDTVDLKAASYTNTIGAAELSAVWTDPDFDPSVRAFYYVRVLEIPTPRWSTYDAAKLDIAPRKDMQATIQERAWTSPIWYTP
ncbi:MAG: DUF3604 domain-containing protein, partial [Burkholderiales bacterium]